MAVARVDDRHQEQSLRHDQFLLNGDIEGTLFPITGREKGNGGRHER
jgi:hypothetical protein